jgi:iron(II)-dependent oxidoreductase
VDLRNGPANGLKTVVAGELEAARNRSIGLLDPLSEEDQTRQHSPIMSPLVWDLAHVGNYEELWLLRAVAGRAAIDPSLDGMYDAFRHPRPDRPALPLLGPAEARRYIGEVRGRVLDVLDTVELDPADPLLDGAFAYGMVVQHEHQHDETMLATRQLMGERATVPLGVVEPPAGGYDGPAEVRVDGGVFPMGTDLEPWAYDNERPAHDVEVAPFWIDAVPVTNAAFAEFVAAGGYDDGACWTAEGWAWRQEADVRHPEFWRPAGDGAWSVLRFGTEHDLAGDEPVQHVGWHEASAFATWAGKRLPAEAEWELAASWAPDGGKRRYPWGDEPPDATRANLGQRHCGPAPVGAYPAGVSPWGCHQMLGDVWEWTASDFTSYPGFRSFPYREYSEVFFGDAYKVLRGGSWATHPLAVRATFRNWDYPVRRQIFAGFRCARDA